MTCFRYYSLALAVVSGVFLGIAIGAQYLFNIQPCVLCLYARYVYMALAIVAMVAFFRPCAGYLVVLVALAGLALSIFHFGVEQHWWAYEKCQAGLQAALTVDDLRQQLMSTTTPRCDEVGWRLLGVSAVFWNALFFLGVALMTLGMKRYGSRCAS